METSRHERRKRPDPLEVPILSDIPGDRGVSTKPTHGRPGQPQLAAVREQTAEDVAEGACPSRHRRVGHGDLLSASEPGGGRDRYMVAVISVGVTTRSVNVTPLGPLTSTRHEPEPLMRTCWALVRRPRSWSPGPGSDLPQRRTRLAGIAPDRRGWSPVARPHPAPACSAPRTSTRTHSLTRTRSCAQPHLRSSPPHVHDTHCRSP
jgi:hypothetical protein